MLEPGGLGVKHGYCNLVRTLNKELCWIDFSMGYKHLMAVERNEGNKWVTATSQGGGLDIQKELEFELLGEGIISILQCVFLPADN